MPCALLTLIGFQLLGDLVADITSLPVPGMVAGLVLLMAVLWLRGRVFGPQKAVPESLSRVAKGLHDNLGLLFVPAGVGIMANLQNLAADAVGLFTAVVVSTLATVSVTGLTAAWLRTETDAPIVAPTQWAP
jgi:holin-like protein